MAKRVTVTTELTTEELHNRYRSAANPVERTHWHILWLMKEGHTPDEVAFMLGYTARWIRTLSSATIEEVSKPSLTIVACRKVLRLCSAQS